KRMANRWPTVILFAKHIKINVSTVYEWLKNHKEFSDAFTRAKELQKIYAGKSVSGTTLLGGLTKDQLSQLNKIQTNIRQDPDIKGFITIRDSYDRTQAAAVDPSAAGDLALIFNYMKMLDPTSVVRESEFATAENAAGVPDKIRNMWNRALTGERITFNRQDFVDTSQRLFRAQQNTQKRLINRYTTLSNRFGLNPQDVITETREIEQQPQGDVLSEADKARLAELEARE
ncbi:hypothetical protein LCGC14_2881330, partial [marine sediment metagenome]